MYSKLLIQIIFLFNRKYCLNNLSFRHFHAFCASSKWVLNLVSYEIIEFFFILNWFDLMKDFDIRKNSLKFGHLVLNKKNQAFNSLSPTHMIISNHSSNWNWWHCFRLHPIDILSRIFSYAKTKSKNCLSFYPFQLLKWQKMNVKVPSAKIKEMVNYETRKSSMDIFWSNKHSYCKHFYLSRFEKILMVSRLLA